MLSVSFVICFSLWNWWLKMLTTAVRWFIPLPPFFYFLSLIVRSSCLRSFHQFLRISVRQISSLSFLFMSFFVTTRRFFSLDSCCIWRQTSFDDVLNFAWTTEESRTSPNPQARTALFILSKNEIHLERKFFILYFLIILGVISSVSIFYVYLPIDDPLDALWYQSTWRRDSTIKNWNSKEKSSSCSCLVHFFLDYHILFVYVVFLWYFLIEKKAFRLIITLLTYKLLALRLHPSYHIRRILSAVCWRYHTILTAW